jgi:hypothetical protein
VAGLFTLAVWRCAPSVGWLDSGSLVSAAWYLGIAHPPGEPAYLSLARIAQLLPVGDIAFRVNLLSALALSLCALPVAALARHGLRQAGFAAGAATAAGVVAALLALLGFGAQLQGVRAELYSLTALLLLAALAAVVVLRGRLASGCAGLLVGLAAAVHPLLTVAALPALVVARGVRSRLRPDDGLWALGLCLWGFSTTLWLPLRALAVPHRAWGVPDSLERFVDVLLARNFAANFGTEEVALADNLSLLMAEWSRAGVPVLLVCAALAGLTWRSHPALRAMVLSLPLWLLGNLMTMAPQNKLYESNPDVLAYLFVGTAAVAPLAAIALVGAFAGPGRHVAVRAGALAVMIILALGLVLDGASANRASNHLPRRFATAQSAALPPGSVLLTSGNDTAFLWTYLQGVELRRADLVLVHRVLLGHLHERNRLLGTDPAPGATISGTALPWTESLRDHPLVVHRAAKLQRPFFIESREIDRAAPEAASLVRHGLVERVAGFDSYGERQPESASLRSVRRALFAEMQRPAFAGDAYARLVRSYYLDIHARPAGGSP